MQVENLSYYEDFAVGSVIDLGTRTVTAEEIIEFATEFDPAPFHLSEEGGKDSMLGRLSASGWHTCCIAMRMQCDAFVLRTASRGSPGVSQCKWLAPVGAGDTLSGVARVLSARRSASRPDMGLVAFVAELFNQSGKPVITIESTAMINVREITGAS
ncbi:MAG: MaoC family dehydratase [Nitratireductor sp.]|nr:MaoC family dehydratase [Nitratireductor sp.]MCB1455012.1 MaoC family dehydratase [Nitratireductor sp.]